MNAAKPIAPRIHSLWRRAPARAIKTHDKYRGNGKQTHDHPALARRLWTRRHVAVGNSRRRQEPARAKRRRRRNGETRPRHGEGGASGVGAARGGEVAGRKVGGVGAGAGEASVSAGSGPPRRAWKRREVIRFAKAPLWNAILQNGHHTTVSEPFLRESRGHFHETGRANAELMCASNAA